MSQRSWAVLTAFACGAYAAFATAAEPRAKAPPGDDVFGLTKVWDFHLEIPAAEWDKMQPTRGRGGPGGFPGGPFGPGGPDRPTEKPADASTDVHRGSGFGTEF